jgi:hypothetical protein
MSSRKRRTPGGAGASGKRTDVGYGRPPAEHQFKPGQSGNKRGRPKGSKNEATIMSELLNRRIDIRERGRTRKASVLEGIFLRFVEDALKGNPKAAAFLLSRKQIMESSEMPAAEILDMDDQKVLESFKQQLEEQFKNKEEGQ